MFGGDCGVGAKEGGEAAHFCELDVGAYFNADLVGGRWLDGIVRCW